MKAFRVMTTAVLTVAMVMSGTGCSIQSEARTKLLETSDKYAKALASCDLNGISSFCDDSFDNTGSQWFDQLTFKQGEYYVGVNSANCAAKIAEAITYELFSDTAKVSDNTASIVCEFSIPDYESALSDDSVRYIYEFYDVLFSEEYVVHSVKLEFELQGDSWIATNYADVMSDLYGFTLLEYPYTTPLADKVIGSLWWGGYGDGYYYNVDTIDLDIQLSSDADYSDMYYVIEYEGEEIKREYGSYEGYLFFYDDNAPTVYDAYNDQYLLAAGEYDITFYDPYGLVLLTDTAYVDLDLDYYGY